MSGATVAFDDVPVALLELAGSTIVAANPVAIALLASVTPTLVGLDLLDLVEPGHRPAVAGLVAELNDACELIGVGERPGRRGRRRHASGGGSVASGGSPGPSAALAVRLGPPPGQPVRMTGCRSAGQVLVALEDDRVGAQPADRAGIVVHVRNRDEGSELVSLADAEGPLLSLAEAAPVGILLMDTAEHVVFASQLGQQLLDLDEADGLDAWRDRVKPSHRALIDAQIQAGLRGAAPVTTTAPVTRLDGTTSWFRVRLAPHLGATRQVVGVIAALEDVTAEVEARADSERLLLMLDATSDFVSVFRPDGTILHANAALQLVLDRLQAEGGTGRLGDLVGLSSDSRDQFIEAAVAKVARSDTWQGEIEIQVGDGKVIPVSALAMVRRDDQGELDWIAMVARDISDLKQADARLRRMATLDHLTGLANRALFTEHLEAVVARCEQTGRSVAMLFCDLDRFKEVNDERGHAVGDAVLQAIATRLREITRDGDLAARVGGDEFVILCEGVADADALATLAERVIESVQRPIEVEGGPVQVGISIGVALAASGGLDGDRLLISADQAMYRAKATGGNRYRIQVLGSQSAS